MPTDTILARALSGETLSGVWDNHLHAGRSARFFSEGETMEKLLATMDRIGVAGGMISVLWNVDERVNPIEGVRAACAQAPSRLLGQLAPNPGLPGFRRTLDRLAGRECFRGVKLHPALHRRDFLCDDYAYAYALAAERRLPVLLHAWGEADVAAFDVMARRFPRTVFIIGHSGGERDASALAMTLAATHPNLYLDTACSFTYHGQIEEMVRVAGDTKILYGSDAIWNSMEAAVSRVALAAIPEESKRRILGENLLRILGEATP